MKRILSLLICATIILSAFSFVMPVYASNEETFIDYIYYNDFTTVNNAAEFLQGTNFTSMSSIYNGSAFVSGFEHTSSGTVKITTPVTSNYSGIIIDGKDANGNIPKLVVSYNIKPKFSRNDSYYYATVQDNRGTSNIALFNNTNSGAGRGIYSGMTESRTWDTANKLQDVASFDGSKWYNITIVYDNDSSKVNNRDIYINGAFVGTHVALATTSYNYARSGIVQISNYFNPNTGDYIEFDNFKAYAYPSELKYELVSASAKEVKLNFNMFPDATTVIPDNFIVKAGSETITPATAKVSSDDLGQVVLTFSEDLTPGTTYTVSAQNVTAGSSATDVADTITLASNPAELSFSVAVPPVEWSETSELYSFDYSNYSEQTFTSFAFRTDGISGAGFNQGIYKIEKDSDDAENKLFTMQQNGSSNTQTYVTLWGDKANYASGNIYALELKIKTDFSKHPEDAIFDTRAQSGYGLNFTALYNGGIYTNGNCEESVGTYTDGEWVTLKNVYYSSPVSVDGVEKLRRDIYINGQFVKTVYDNWSALGSHTNGSSHFLMTMRIRDIDDSDGLINTEGKVYIDYIRIYKPNADFAAKLDKAEDIDTGYINVKFNNIPAEADLTDKIYIADENGVKVSDISVPEFVNEFNADGYAAKVNLWFTNELELGKTYKLCINGVNDIKENTLRQEETFTTKAAPEAKDLTLSGGKATVTVNEYSEPLTLYVVGYNFVDDVEQMTTVTKKEITSVGTFSTETAVTGDVVKAFLWKGTKPVIACESEGNN